MHEAKAPIDAGRQKQVQMCALMCIVVIGILFGSWLVRIVADTRFVGYADPAAYGHVAANIIKGRGPVQDFIDFYFTPHPDITHRSEHWFTLYTLFLVPIMAVCGKTVMAVKLPALLSWFLLPIATFILCRYLVAWQAAFMTALCVIVHPYVVEYAINGWPDLPHTLLSIVCIMLFLNAFNEKQSARTYLLFGLLTGALCWFRATGFLLVGGLAIHALFRHQSVLRRSLLPWLIIPAFAIGYLPAVIMSSDASRPWGGSHAVLSATMGYYGNPEEEHWQLYRDSLPSLAALVREEGIRPVVRKTLRELSSLVRQRDYFERNPPLIMLVGLPLMLSGLWWLFAGGTVRFQREPAREPPAPVYPFSRHLVAVLCLIYLTGLAVLFKMNSRYLFLCMIVLMAAGWEGAFLLFGTIERRIVREWSGLKTMPPTAISLALAMMLLLLMLGPAVTDMIAGRGDPGTAYPMTDDHVLLSDFELIHRYLPAGEAVMVTMPWSFTFHTGRRSVMVPYGNVGEMLMICDRYGIRWFVDLTNAGHNLLGDYPAFSPRLVCHRAVIYRVEPTHRDHLEERLAYRRPNWQLFDW